VTRFIQHLRNFLSIQDAHLIRGADDN